MITHYPRYLESILVRCGFQIVHILQKYSNCPEITLREDASRARAEYCSDADIRKMAADTKSNIASAGRWRQTSV